MLGIAVEVKSLEPPHGHAVATPANAAVITAAERILGIVGIKEIDREKGLVKRLKSSEVKRVNLVSDKGNRKGD